jgi:argininosuccinate lyase
MFNQVLYEKDFYAWLEHTINLLKQGRLSELNTDILIDELESIAKRDQIEKQLEDSPSFKNQLETLMIKAYPDAVKLAQAETGLAASQFSKVCEYTIKQILLDEFYPG